MCSKKTAVGFVVLYRDDGDKCPILPGRRLYFAGTKERLEKTIHEVHWFKHPHWIERGPSKELRDTIVSGTDPIMVYFEMFVELKNNVRICTSYTWLDKPQLILLDKDGNLIKEDYPIEPARQCALASDLLTLTEA